MIRHLDLFAGIGGFSRAVEWLRGETVAFVEWEAWNRRVLAKHWPEARFFSDIKTVTNDDLRGLGRIDLITGGYPCQPFSVAGQRRGEDDDRHLWPEMRRVINALRPRFVLAENVAGHITMGLDTVLAEMESDGYTCGAVVVPACAVNALHRRDRVWIMAHTRHDRSQAELQPRSSQPQHAATRDTGPHAVMADATARGLRRGSAPGSPGQPARGGEGIPDTYGRRRHPSEHNRGGTASSGTSSDVAAHGTTRQETPRSLDPRADGLPAGSLRQPTTRPADIRAAWADGSWEIDLPRVVTDEPERRQKLMAAGNAIVPQVAYEILRVMLEDAA